jgi:hypothetical protein
LPKGNWQSIRILDSDCRRHTIDFIPQKSASLRILVNGNASAPVSLSVVATNGRAQFSSVRMAPRSVLAGGDATISGQMRLGFDDGKYRAIGGQSILVQVFGSSGWNTIGRTQTRSDGTFRYTVSPNAPSSYRVANGTTTSATVYLSVVPRTPVRLSVAWPSIVYIWDSLVVKADVIDNAGKFWSGSVRLILQYRASRYDGWRNLDYDDSTGSHTAVMVAAYQGDGYYRVYSPDYGFSSEMSYA